MNRSIGGSPTGYGRPTLFTRDFLLLWFGSLALYGSFHMFVTTLPLCARGLGARDLEVGLLSGVFSLAALVMRLLTGWRLDRSRRVPVMAAGAAGFVVCSAAYGFAGSSAALLALRILHGAGMAAYGTASQVLAIDLVPPSRRGEAMGIFGLVHGLTIALAPAMGMAILLTAGPGWLFAVSAALAVVASVLGALVAEPTPTRTRPLSGPPFNPKALLPGFVILSSAVAASAAHSFLPLYGVAHGLVNPGFYFTVWGSANMLARVLAGRISDRFGRGGVILFGLALAGAGTAAIALLDGWWLLAAGLISGLGLGAAEAPLLALVADITSLDERGSAIGTLGMFLEIGSITGSVAAGVLAERLGLASVFLAAGAAPALGALWPS